MNQFIIIASATALLCATVNAQDYLFVHHYIDSPGLDKLGEAELRKETREEVKEAREEAEKQAAKKAEEDKVLFSWFKTLVENHLQPTDHQMRGRFLDWLRDNGRLTDEIRQMFSVQPASVEGDPLPLSNDYDDAATIKIYLHDLGYTDLSDAQIASVIAYMKANGIYHVSELLK